MSKARRPLGTARGQGSYVNQACAICRHKKIKCDGGKPSCDTCINNGREQQCNYGKEAPRRPRTEAHVQAILRNLESHREYIRQLESVLDHYAKEYPNSVARDMYLKLRPPNWDELPESPEEPPVEVAEEEEEETGAEDVAKELCLPTKNLQLGEEGGLLLHGATAPFRYISDPSRLPLSSGTGHWSITDNPDEYYTLLIDSADEMHYNPNLDWSRHLPQEVHLERKEHDKILDLVFKFFTSWCLRIVPRLFLRDMYRALSVPKNQPAPRLSHYSPMLHNAVLALGATFSDDPNIRDLRTRMCFLDKAKSYLEDECSRPHLSVVNALSLIGSFHSGQGDQTLGYVFFGMSARVSQALGLWVDCSSWVESGVITAEDQMDRNWAYWSTVCQDVCWSLYVGRQYSIQTTSKNIPIPFADADFDKMDWVYRPAGKQPQPGYEAKAFAETCRLLDIGKSIMDIVNALDGTGSRQPVLDPKISEIDLQLHDWNSKLPDELKNTVKMRQNPTPHLLQLHLSYEWCFILLHRPFFKKRSSRSAIRDHPIENAKICQRAADGIMALLSAWRTHFTFRYSPITLVQPIFCAGTVYLLSALQAVAGVRIANAQLRQSMENGLLCIKYLKELGESWPCAMSIANILRDWINHIKPSIQRRTAFSPFSSGILPPKAQEGHSQAQAQPQPQPDDSSDKTQTKRKSKTLTPPNPRKRHRSSSIVEDTSPSANGKHNRRDGSPLPPPAPSISIDAIPGSRSINGTTKLSRSPLVNQALQLPTPPALPSPRNPSFQLEPSPQPPVQRHSPYNGHSPLPNVNLSSHPQIPPQPRLQSQPSSQSVVSLSPRPPSWSSLPENGGDSAMTDGTPPRIPLPAIPLNHHPAPALDLTLDQSQAQNPGQSRSSSHTSTSPSNPKPLGAPTSSNSNPNNSNEPDSFNHEVNRNALAKTFAPHFAPLFSKYHPWAPTGLNFAPHATMPGGTSVHNVNGPSNTPADAVLNAAPPPPVTGSTRPTSPVSYQLAMPNGQRLWETPFLPFDMSLNDGTERDNEPGLGGQDGEGIPALAEFGFEFISRFGDNKPSAPPGAPAIDLDMDMDWRGKDEWEDIDPEAVTEDFVREEEIISWFNGISEN